MDGPQQAMGNFIDFFFLQKIGGWAGILIYFLKTPVTFSITGLIFYLAIKYCFLILSKRVISENFSDQPYLKFATDHQERRFTARRIKKRLKRRMPWIEKLLPRRYDYSKVNLNSDIDKLRLHNKRQRSRSVARFMVSTSSARARLKSRNDRIIEDFLTQNNVIGEPKSRATLWQEILLETFRMLFISIPSEDGFFFAPAALLGINPITATLFAFAFGFAHSWKYSVLNCLRISLSAFLIILVILPTYGLMTCIIGHILYDVSVGIIPLIILKVLDKQFSRR